jgi:hypothetical protein
MTVKKYTLDTMRVISGNHGGRVVSTKYSSKEMIFNCKKGHEFKRKPNNIIQGDWCTICSGYKKDLEAMRTFAKNNHGKLLSQTYISSMEHLLWECSKRHVIKSSYNTLFTRVRKNKNWCLKCERSSKINANIDQDQRERNSAYPNVWPATQRLLANYL